MVLMSYEDMETWKSQGNCQEHPPEIFFPEDGKGVLKAQVICRPCPVKEVCLDHALKNRIDHGVWGGESERGRRRLIRAMRRANEKQADAP